MKITHRLLRETRQSNRQTLHPQSWHDFQGQPEVVSINYALEVRQPYDSDRDILERARDSFDTIYGGNK